MVNPDGKCDHFYSFSIVFIQAQSRGRANFEDNDPVKREPESVLFVNPFLVDGFTRQSHFFWVGEELTLFRCLFYQPAVGFVNAESIIFK